MHREGEEVHVSTNEARAGRKGSFLLQILVISLILVVAAMAGLWLFGSQTAPSQGGPVTEISPT
jgi:flagellar basal body-associated protein FliL